MENENRLEGTTFELELVKALLVFTPKHMKVALNDSSIDYNEYGGANEKLLKEILHYFSNIYSVLKDLDFTLLFLQKDRKSILEHYPNIESQKNYYSYHFENYYIRLVTLSDILGRLGNLVYALEIHMNKSTLYIFKDRARRKGFEEISAIADKLTSTLEHLKNERHKKLHTGNADFKALDGVVLWEDLNKILGSETDQILIEHTDNELEERFQKLKTETFQIIDIIREFLELSTEKIVEISKTKS